MSGVQSFVGAVVDAVINPLIALLSVAALFVFFWGLARFLWYADADEERKKGKQHMLWGIIGLFIMVGVFGILNILLNTFGISLPS